MEILCCLALYLHALDSRNAAHVTIGQAMRIAQANGMHTDMPAQELGGPLVQRCRQIWWTRRAALEMQIKISHAYADIGRTVYGPQTQPKKEFVTNIKAMVLLVIRPILFCCLERTLQAPIEASRLIASNKVRQIISLSSETALNMLNMLEGLKDQGLLETFLPWDFEALFVTTSTLILIGVIDSTLLPEDTSHTEKIPVLFEYMIASGNDVAAHRDKELRWLKTMLEELTATTVLQGQNDRRLGTEPTATASKVSQVAATLEQGVSAKCTTSVEDRPGHVIGLQEPFAGSSHDGIGFGQDLTADQVIFLAESMDIEEIDWTNLVMSDVEGPWGN
ncbi:hypothetical protein E8E13_011301 [Curvularia kusanoi]|uniref:Transcription factor domain-containing protein n=1 Tax=Curvularia kusanoi TaxID=90978 RepID=A0A9P4TPR4_CURKU|nr:hypothetical protein E8E13_011301 [Curvularia kusanoi]